MRLSVKGTIKVKESRRFDLGDELRERLAVLVRLARFLADIALLQDDRIVLLRILPEVEAKGSGLLAPADVSVAFQKRQQLFFAAGPRDEPCDATVHAGASNRLRVHYRFAWGLLATLCKWVATVTVRPLTLHATFGGGLPGPGRAVKFQTGFDQPLVHSMHVDKVLTGVNAVQTLFKAQHDPPRQRRHIRAGLSQRD